MHATTSKYVRRAGLVPRHGYPETRSSVPGKCKAFLSELTPYPSETDNNPEDVANVGRMPVTKQSRLSAQYSNTETVTHHCLSTAFKDF
jgi:hypothetical protein